MITCPQCGHANSGDSTFCTECGKPLKVKDDVGTLNTPNPNDYKKPAGGASLELAPGAVFAGRYTIVEKIGQGGMGVVYRATEQLGSITRELALKLIRADQLADSGAVDRLMSEGVLTQDISHNNVVKVYNIGVAQNSPFVAMEYVDGINLRDWIRRQRYADTQMDPPPIALVASLLRSILDGLAAAHARGVVHRDLKPENVILLGDPTAEAAPLKILDFGIASAPGKVGSVTGTGLGTPNYMAPEQITNPAGANPSSDLYSLSKMFYELLMGVLPTGHWQAPSGGRGDVPEAVDKLILQGLSDAQRMRPQSAEDYRAALDKALGGKLPGPVKPNNLFGGDGKPPPPPPSGKGMSTGMKIGLGIGGAVLALIGIGSIPDEGGGPRDPVFSDYSGTWQGSQGTMLNVSVDDGGNVAGNGTAPGYAFGVNGSIPAGSINFTYDNGAVFSLDAQIPGDWCHVVMNAFDPVNNVPITEQFHVNHNPGDDCPALYSN